MNILDLAKADWQTITGNKDGGFGRDMTITTPDGQTTASIVGLSSKHYIGYDSEGNTVNVKNAHISFSEQLLTDLSYPIRNINGEVQLRGHKIVTKDSTGIDKTYIVTENFPDETIGVVVCILGDFAGSSSDENSPSYLWHPKDANIQNSDLSYIVSVASGATFELPDITISNSDDSFSETKPAAIDIELADETINLTDANDNILQTIINPVYKDLIIEIPITPKAGIQYKRPIKTGRLTSYRTGDDRWRVDNMPYPAAPTNPLYCQELVDFFTLKHDNAFGNRLRFTDINGLATITDDKGTVPDLSYRYIIDNLTGLAMNHQATYLANVSNWDTSIDDSLSLVAEGFDDYFLPNANELISFMNFDGSFYGIALLWAGGNRNLHSSATYNLNVTQSKYVSTVANLSIIGKTSTVGYVPIRIHF